MNVIPYEFEDIKNALKQKAMTEFGLTDAQYEGSNVSQLINLLAYSGVINNSNLTFAINEMFITEAKDRRNVIKHSRQMGYKNKRKTSYQYKIKLKVLEYGEVALEKYTEFESEGKTYVYLEDNIVDVYGIYTNLKLLFNENNNGLSSPYNTNEVQKDTYVINESGTVCRVLDKTVTGQPRLLLEPINGDINLFSEEPKNLYIWDGTRDPNTNYRNLTKVGTIDTYLYDSTTNIFKVQISPVIGIDFPVFTRDILNSTIILDNGDYKLANDTLYPIKKIESVIVNDGFGSISISLDEITFAEGDHNIILPSADIAVSEEHNDLVNNPDKSANVTVLNDVIPGSLKYVNLLINNNIRKIDVQDLILVDRTITIPAQSTDKTESLIITSGSVTLSELPKSISKVMIGSTIITDYTLNNSTLTFTGYEGQTVTIEYDYYEDLSSITAYVNYSYVLDITGQSVVFTYVYDRDNDGLLDKRFFIDDFRGVSLESEYPSTVSLGWDGFAAFDYDSETNVLSFLMNDVNRYASTLVNGVIVPGDFMNNVIKSPLKRTRFSLCTPIYDEGVIVSYTPYDINSIIGYTEEISYKDSLEITVKEGTVLKWFEETEESITARENAINNGLEIPDPVYVYPDLSIEVNQYMVDAGYFVVNKDNIEESGLELFVSRVLEDGTIEYDVPWKERRYLLAESTDDERTYVVLEDTDYEDYLNVYTRYAGSGTKLTNDFIVRLNLLITSGSDGSTRSLIVPKDSDKFEAIEYIDAKTPVLLHITGSDKESIDDIRQNAPLYSNTANRAVTEKDYLTITKAQGFIQDAKVWGGEKELPEKRLGHIIFSIIPESRPKGFVLSEGKYVLDRVQIPSLFYPLYYQITGAPNYYTQRNETDLNVLFNILNEYKIITLQLDYRKTIYLDHYLSVNILKYKSNETISSTNSRVFNIIRDFYVDNVEKFDVTLYKSTLLKYIDAELGDDLGVELDINTSVEIFDNLTKPDEGSFINDTMTDIEEVNGISGTYDRWKFEMYLDINYKDLFEPDIVVNNQVVEYGSIKVLELPDITTENFLKFGDKLYLSKDVGTIKAFDLDDNSTIGEPRFRDVRIVLDIMYKETESSYPYKVGTYIAYKTQNIVYIKLDTHLYDNIENSTYIDTVPEITSGVLDDLSPNVYKEVPLPRTSFLTSKKLKIKNPSSTIKTRRNTFNRLREISF